MTTRRRHSAISQTCPKLRHRLRILIGSPLVTLALAGAVVVDVATLPRESTALRVMDRIAPGLGLIVRANRTPLKDTFIVYPAEDGLAIVSDVYVSYHGPSSEEWIAYIHITWQSYPRGLWRVTRHSDTQAVRVDHFTEPEIINAAMGSPGRHGVADFIDDVRPDRMQYLRYLDPNAYDTHRIRHGPDVVTHIVWSGYLLNVLSALMCAAFCGSAAMAARDLWRRRGNDRLERGECRRCGYDLIGLPPGTGVCPECGCAIGDQSR